MFVLNGIWNAMKWLGGTLFPFFTRTRWRGLPGALRWIVHFVLMFSIILLLWFLNYYFALERILRSPWPNLHKVWLPMLFVFLYALLWLGSALWKLLGPDHGTRYFPDMDAAWSEAMAALHQASIDVTAVPIYVVLGRPASSEECLFQAARLPLSVQQTPSNSEAPLHVYATREAIYVTCAESSLVGHQAGLWNQEPHRQKPATAMPAGHETRAENASGAAQAKPAPANPAPAAAAEGGSKAAKNPVTDPFAKNLSTVVSQSASQVASQATASLPAPSLAVPSAPTVASQTVASPTVPSLSTSGVLKVLAEHGVAPQPESRRLFVDKTPQADYDNPSTHLLKNKEAMENLTARLEYLCELIAGERSPYCSLNGIFILVPWVATESDVQASHFGTLCQNDLATLRESLQVECPLSVVLCDLERVDGFREFLKRLSPQQKLMALGQRFALIPDLEPEEIPHMFEGGVDTLIERELANTIYNMFHEPTLAIGLSADSVSKQALSSGMLRGNMKLFQFLSHLRQRRKRLGRIVYRGTCVEPEAPPMVAGCYFVGTGIDSAQEQAFVAGVFDEMLENQNFVSWTPGALQEEWRYRRFTRVGYFLAVALVIAVAVGCYIYILNR